MTEPKELRAKGVPLVWEAILHLFDHPCLVGRGPGRKQRDRCPHLSPEERAAFDAFMAEEW